ncbi:Pyridoxal phosphate-dependent transferase [Phytophthora cactorum]|nr:Pyridoxal phosphate-dependent transferase [Phytophthora cactorum]
MAVINPATPRVSVCRDIESIIKFCKKENILILADEVYQRMCTLRARILFFKKVLRDMGKEYDDVELISFHSTSKGFTGEWRQGSVLQAHVVNLCSNIEGQCCGDDDQPAAAWDASYERYAEQRDGTLGSLKRRAVKLVKAFNELEGSRVEAAKEAGMAPDAFYCTQMLDDTGIVVVPGSGFGQKEGTWHFRTTILPPRTPWTM